MIDAKPSSYSPRPGTPNRGAAKTSAGPPKRLLATPWLHARLGEGTCCVSAAASALRDVRARSPLRAGNGGGSRRAAPRRCRAVLGRGELAGLVQAASRPREAT